MLQGQKGLSSISPIQKISDNSGISLRSLGVFTATEVGQSFSCSQEGNRLHHPIHPNHCLRASRSFFTSPSSSSSTYFSCCITSSSCCCCSSTCSLKCLRVNANSSESSGMVAMTASSFSSSPSFQCWTWDCIYVDS